MTGYRYVSIDLVGW